MSPDTSTGESPIDFGEYLAAVWRYRRSVAVVTVLCMTAAFAYSVTRPREYQAVLTLAVSQAKFGDVGGQAAVSPAEFRPLFESPTLAQAVIRDLGLDKPPDGITPSVLLSRVIAIQEVHGTNLIRLTASFGDPGRAAAIAQRVGQRAVDVAHALSADEQTRSRSFIKDQLDQTKARLDQANTQLRTYRDQAQFEALKKDVDSTLLERGKILALLVEIEGERAKLDKAKEERDKRKRIDTLKKTVDSDPAMSAASRDRAPAGTSVGGLQMQSESVSEVFEKLDAEVAIIQANLASLEKQKAQLVDVRGLDAGRLPQLTLLYQREGELARLQAEYELDEKLYADIALRYEISRLQVASRTAELAIVDPAFAPELPVSRNVVRNTALAGFAGLGGAALAAMLLHALSLGTRRRGLASR